MKDAKEYRHFKALMRKNMINWKRTPIGTTLEVLLPVLLMVALAIARRRVQPQIIDDLNLHSLRHPLYPIASPLQNGSWLIDSFNGSIADSNLQGFMKYANYTNFNNSVYVPLLDPLGPYLFFPPQCYASQGDSKYSSPIIGYVTTGSQLESDLISQLQLLFAMQKSLIASQQMSQSANQSLQNFQSTIKSIASKATSASLSGGPSSFGSIGNGSGIGNFTLKAFPDQKTFDAYIQNERYGSNSQPAICFGFKASQNTSTNSYELELMFNDQSQAQYQSIPSQLSQSAPPTQFLPQFAEYSQYSWNGFSYLQNWAANSILKRKTGISSASFVAMTVPMKSATLQQDDFSFVLQISLTAIIFLMYIPPLYRTVFRIVVEKESRVKESMRMMGMTDFSYWLSWFAYYFLINFLVSTLSWIVLNYAVFAHSNGFLVWVLMWLFGQSLFSLILVAQSLFSRARQAAYITTSLYFGLAMLQFLVNDPQTEAYKKIIASFSPTVALSQSLVVLIEFETSGIGLNFANVNTVYQNFTVTTGLFMLAIDTVLWLLVGMYLEIILPKEFGQRRHPCFCFIRKINIPKTQDEVQLGASECFETLSQEVGERPSLTINSLFKKFEQMVAVDGITCQMYEDQIFVMLGHNGAGKTTMISVLTGLIEPSSYVNMTVHGLKIVEQMDEVRKIMGVCPQHDVLFDLLTPMEHLDIFFDFRNEDQKNKYDQNKKLIEDVGLADKKSALAYQLSGGNKRKLSVAIALCGNSKFILLDEPTSGMDIQTRRQLWNTLREYKKGRIILLTTHYMDEADILGDRIGIMCKGKITCLGSPLFLKNRFGVGYNLNIIKTTKQKNYMFEDYIHKNLTSDAKCIAEVEAELIYQVPAQSGLNFENFFTYIDQNLTSLQIQSYGISISTLEEIFLKIGHLANPLSIFDPIIETDDSPVRNLPQLSDNEKIKLELVEEEVLKDSVSPRQDFTSNVTAALLKRFWIYRHNKKSIFTETVYPAVVMIYGVLLTQFIYTTRSPSRILDPSIIGSQIGPLIFNNLMQGKSSPMVAGISQTFKDKFQVDYISKNTWNATREQIYQVGHNNITRFPYLYSGYDMYSMNTTSQQYQFYNHMNLTCQDVAGLYPQFMYEELLKFAVNETTLVFKTRSTPYPPTSSQAQATKTTSAGTIIFMTAVAYSTLMTMICSFLVNERVSGLKHLQIISGIQLKSYWVGNFIFDLLKMYITVLVSIILLWSFNMGYTSCQYCFLAFPFAVLPFTYVYSFVFKSEASSQTYVMFGYLMTILTLPTLIFVLRTVQGLENLSDALHWIFRILLPTYCLGSSIYLDQSASLIAGVRALRGMHLSADVWNIWNVLGDLVCLLLQMIIWTIVLIRIETQKQGKAEDVKINLQTVVDADVQNETQRVLSGHNKFALKVENFSKVYLTEKRTIIPLCQVAQEQVIAVSNLNFGVEKGECLCLLGVNGAGKSSTFKALTCEIQASSGHIEIQGKNVATHFSEVKTMIGYCPQWNSIFDSMTVKEHLLYYARAKGIPFYQQQKAVDDVISELGLDIHRQKLAGTLSGGNKRKLSVAIAIIGKPPLILLDEPSAGMDPEARRLMWKVVAKLTKNRDCAVVFTTHDMEEAEALSTKLGIMTKGGVLQCFGSAQHIRQKFGQGYIVQIKTTEQSATQETELQQNSLDVHQTAVLVEFCRAFGGRIDCLERYGTFLKLRLSKDQDSVSLGRVFGVVERMKQAGSINEYSVNQTTLEQIFQTFANQSSTSQIRHYELEDGQLVEKQASGTIN